MKFWMRMSLNLKKKLNSKSNLYFTHPQSHIFTYFRFQSIEREIEEKIVKRRDYLLYLTDIYNIIYDIDNLLQSDLQLVEKDELNYYHNTLLNYQFGLANQDLKKYSSIDGSLKYMRALFKEVNTPIINKFITFIGKLINCFKRAIRESD